MAEEIREALNLLNDKLSGLFPYRLELTTPGELKLLDKNARYMKAEQFQTTASPWPCSLPTSPGETTHWKQ